MTFTITSTAFQDGGAIPARYTCQGRDVSPPLSFAGVPAGTLSVALVVEDPDAPDPAAPRMVWDHWVVWNIQPSMVEIPEGETPAGAIIGRNSWSENSYGGPCPPIGTHRYFFKAFALDTTLDLPPTVDKQKLLAAMQGHVLATAEMVGTYRKS